ncbi:MAG: hypothetical protein IJR66_00570 [Clostridia bacterium]|nr:hypothetical protein [Clostridia bacterium]
MFFNINLVLDVEKKKYQIIVKLFFIKIFRLLVISKSNGLYLIKGKKEVKITAKIVKALNNNIDIIKDYHVLKIDINSEIGDFNKYNYFIFYNLLINKILLIFLTIKKPYVKSKNLISIDNEDIFLIDVKIQIVINLLIIVLSIIKIIIRIIKAKWKEKKTELKTLWKRQ